MAAVTATPVSYFLVTLGATATPASGESQRKGESPFLSTVNARQLSAEATWQDALGYGMSLLDLEAEVRVRWAPSDRKTTRLNSSHYSASRMPSSACKKKTKATATTKVTD